MTAVPTSRQAAAAGGRAIIPLTLGVIPFGLAYGVAASQVEVIDPWLAITASLLIIAGAAQLSLVGLIGDGAPWLVAVGTALVINARFALYSAALAPAFRAFPRAWRLALPYMMTDQAAALSLDYNARIPDATARRWFYTGAAATITLGWMAGTTVGVIAGASIPEELELEFAVPLVFLALVVPTLCSRPALAAAGTAAIVATVAAGLPNGLNIITGALAGIVVGSVLNR